MQEFKETKIGLIPKEWGIIKAKDFCLKVTDGTHDTPIPQTDGYHLVTSKNLVDSRIDFSSCYCISEQDFNQINQRSGVEQFDVLFGMIGTVGNTAIIKQPEINFAIKNVGLFKLNRNYDKAVWLKNFLSSHIFYNYLRRQMAGTTQQFVGLGFLRKAPIIIPKNNYGEIDWTIVKAINHTLSKVDAAITATQNSIKAAEKLKKALMQNLLTGKLKPDGTWRNEEEFYEDEKFGKVPMGWVVERFKNRITVQYGKSQKDIVSEKGKIPIYGTGGVIEYGISALCENESILIGRKGTIDKPFYIDVPFWAVDTTYYVESFENGNMKFLFYLLQGLNLKSLNEATGVPSLTRRTLNRQMLLLPSLLEQNEITYQIDKFYKIIGFKQTKIQKLERLKKALMQNLLTGKVRLPETFVAQFEMLETDKKMVNC